MTRARQWSVLTAVACLAVLAVGWFVLVKPQRTHAASLRSQASQVDQDNQALQAQIAHLRAQAKDLSAQQRKLADIATKVPDSPALPSLIRQLSTAADSAGVNLVSLAPGQPALAQAAPAAATTATAPGTTGAAAPAATTATAAAPAAGGVVLASIPLQIQVQGSYFNLEQFFSAVEAMPRAMEVTQFSAAPVVPGTSTTNGPTVAPGTLNVTLTASVFMSPNTAVAGITPTGK
jgi:Tfp pilus assembly protein PilO